MKILEQLKIKFPDCWFKEGVEFDGGSAAAWSGEDSWIKEEAAFDMYADQNFYEFGVHPKLARFVESKGYFWEAYDNGTFLLYKN